MSESNLGHTMMKIRSTASLAGLALVLTACGGGMETEQPVPLEPIGRGPEQVAPPAPEQPPEPLPAEDVDFPDYAERTLENGARLLVVENHEQPVVSVQLILPAAGSAADPDDMAGLASVTAAQIDKGTESMTALDIAEAVDFIGANLGASASGDWSSVYLTTLTDFLDEGLELMSDVVMNPTFPAEELETETQQRLSALQLERSQPAALAQRAFDEGIYGAHPYGQSPTVASIEAIDTGDLERFHRQNYRPGNALFVVAGDVDPDEIQRKLELAFAQWEGEAEADMTRAAPPQRSGRTLRFVHKPGLVQAVVRMGHLLPSATEADWVSLDVANQILGDPSAGFSGRMMKELRDARGWTYGAYSRATERPGPGYFVMSGEFRNEVADSALEVMIELAEQIRAGNVPPEDLEAAKQFLTGSFPLSIQMPQQVAGQIASNRMLGRPDQYLEQYRSRVEATDARDVQQAARQYVRPDESLIVVVGDATQVLDRVRRFADRVEVVDTEGEPLDLQRIAEQAEAAANVSFSAADLKPREMRYGIRFQGNEVGTVVTRWTREGDAFAVVSEQTLPNMAITQRTEFDALTFAPIRTVTSLGPAGEFAMEVEDGRAIGQGFDPQRGPQDVDVELQPGTFLEGQMDVAMAVHDFENAGEFTLNTLTMAGTVQPQTVRVVVEETVEVPAGTFETYKLEVAGQQTQTIWVTRGEPHIVVKIAPAGQPVEIVLTQM